MREIDSTRNSEARLSQALRSLSASSPAEAPTQIGEVLVGAFRRRHARRRAIRRTAAAAVICMVLPATVLLVVSGRHHKSNPDRDVVAVVASHPAKTAATPVAVASPLPVRKKSHAPSGRSYVPAAAGSQVVVDGFVDLPTSDQAVRGEDLRVVRLEVTGRALQMVGAPVAEENADNRMLADFIVGQDGTPYAVRLVR
jgi:hypothetical protein